ncbi:hypothetical protein B7L51_003865 [Pectobacterium brasiliense]|uniref:hypothetical protein n=1 Tax=Pectobacterium brasiliense TaxID=180957 RepID=UPI000B96366E|nr:hypothetical protein [Pectobacterium carotovorum]OYN52658.1 hypothetical protein B7L51_03900 [Pectobacterium carotovorum]
MGKPGITLTAAQIKELAQFAIDDGQQEYTITHAYIPAFTAKDDSEIPEYHGLIAYSGSENSGVLQFS